MSLQLSFELPPDVYATRSADGDDDVLRNLGKQGGKLNRFVDGETEHSLYDDHDNDDLRALAAAVNDVEWADRFVDDYHFEDPADLEECKRLFESYARAGASMRSSF